MNAFFFNAHEMFSTDILIFFTIYNFPGCAILSTEKLSIILNELINRFHTINENLIFIF